MHKPRCVFQKSKYYQQAHADPSSICPPLSYLLFEKQAKPLPERKQKTGQLQTRYLPDRSIMRTISTRGTPSRELYRYLKVGDLPHSVDYISSLSSENLNKIREDMSPQLISELKALYFPRADSRLELVELSTMLSSLGYDELFRIKDYSLETYCIYFEGLKVCADYLHELLDESLIEYRVQMLYSPAVFDYANNNLKQDTNHGKHMRLTDILKCRTAFSIEEADSRIEEILRTVKKTQSSPMTHQIELGQYMVSMGQQSIHFYFADCSNGQSSEDILREEEEIYSLLQYHVYILTRVLRDGQTAILKIRGSYSHRTSEYLFLLKLVFSDRLLMHKNIASNPFSSHKYFICEKYNRENGLIVHEYLRQNYGLLTEQRQLLLNREAMFGQDFQFNIMKFNNSNPLFTCFKQLCKAYQLNSNLAFYPSKQALLKKLHEIEGPRKEQLIHFIQQAIPDEPQAGQKHEEPVQKAGVNILDCFEFIQQTEAKKQKKEKKQHKHQGQLDQYLDRFHAVKKEKNKVKANRKRKEEKSPID